MKTQKQSSAQRNFARLKFIVAMDITTRLITGHSELVYIII